MASFALSFAGSVPPGLVSLSLVQTGKSGGYRLAIRWAFWASLIELIHLGLALTFHIQLQWFPNVEWIARPLALLILIGSGVHLVLRKQTQTNQPILSFQSFITLNLLNPMAIPFWLGALQIINPDAGSAVSVLLGSFLGAWLCLSVYSWAGSLAGEWTMISTRQLNQFIGWLMIIPGCWQLLAHFRAFVSIFLN